MLASVCGAINFLPKHLRNAHSFWPLTNVFFCLFCHRWQYLMPKKHAKTPTSWYSLCRISSLRAFANRFKAILRKMLLPCLLSRYSDVSRKVISRCRSGSCFCALRYHRLRLVFPFDDDISHVACCNDCNPVTPCKCTCRCLVIFIGPRYKWERSRLDIESDSTIAWNPVCCAHGC